MLMYIHPIGISENLFSRPQLCDPIANFENIVGSPIMVADFYRTVSESSRGDKWKVIASYDRVME